MDQRGSKGLKWCILKKFRWGSWREHCLPWSFKATQKFSLWGCTDFHFGRERVFKEKDTNGGLKIKVFCGRSFRLNLNFPRLNLYSAYPPPLLSWKKSSLRYWIQTAKKDPFKFLYKLTLKASIKPKKVSSQTSQKKSRKTPSYTQSYF